MIVGFLSCGSRPHLLLLDMTDVPTLTISHRTNETFCLGFPSAFVKLCIHLYLCTLALKH